MKHELPHDKPTRWHVCQVKTQISLGICIVWSESFLCTLWVAKDLTFLQVESEDWSDWVDADLSLCWAHWSFCWFCHAAAQSWENPPAELCDQVRLKLVSSTTEASYSLGRPGLLSYRSHLQSWKTWPAQLQKPPIVLENLECSITEASYSLENPACSATEASYSLGKSGLFSYRSQLSLGRPGLLSYRSQLQSWKTWPP